MIYRKLKKSNNYRIGRGASIEQIVQQETKH
jgi:hypothetical protein